MTAAHLDAASIPRESTSDILRRIERVHPGLAEHLRASVTTGTRCAYAPATPVIWRL